MTVSAMLNRPDAVKLPIAFIPNQDQNDICDSFSIDSVDRALDYIVKGHLLRSDVLQVRVDHKQEGETLIQPNYYNTKYAI